MVREFIKSGNCTSFHYRLYSQLTVRIRKKVINHALKLSKVTSSRCASCISRKAKSIVSARSVIQQTKPLVFWLGLI